MKAIAPNKKPHSQNTTHDRTMNDIEELKSVDDCWTTVSEKSERPSIFTSAYNNNIFYNIITRKKQPETATPLGTHSAKFRNPKSVEIRRSRDHSIRHMSFPQSVFHCNRLCRPISSRFRDIRPQTCRGHESRSKENCSVPNGGCFFLGGGGLKC